MARFQKYRLSWPVTSSQWYNVDAMFSEIYADIAAGQSIPNTAVVPGTYGSATQIPVFTVNETGNLTFASSVAIPVTAAAAGTLTGTTLAPNVIFSSLTTVGTLVGGATGPGFTINVGPGESPIVGLIPTANLGLRTATNNTFLRGDQVWASTTEAIPAIVDVQSTNNGMATGTYSVGPFLTNPNVGDTIVVCTWVQGSPVSAVAPTDTLGNTYTQIGTNATSPGDGFGFPVTWAAVSIATGSCTISSVNTNRAMAIAWLISGAGVYNGDYQSALSTGGVAAIASGPSSPAPAPGSIFLSFTSQDTSPTGVFTYGLGWNTTGVNGFTSAMIASGRNWIEESSVGGIHVDSEYSISSAVRNGTYTSPSAGSWGAVVFSFAPGTRPVIATSVPGTALTGTILASNIVTSSLTHVGTLATLTVTATITGSISGNAATVTTNANLTGPITSVGNATSIASQTGTGSTFVMSVSPTITGLIGNTAGLSLNLSGNINFANNTGFIFLDSNGVDAGAEITLDGSNNFNIVSLVGTATTGMLVLRMNPGKAIRMQNAASTINLIQVNDAGTTVFNSNKLGLGIAPVALLHIAAGTATAGTAPFRLTSGVLLTVPVTGALEFVAGVLSFTDNTPTRHSIAYLDGPSFTGSVSLAGKIGNYNGVATVSNGVPAIYGTGRSAAAVAAVPSVATYTNAAVDGSFIVSANVNVTTSTLHNFTVTCAYTDETNTPRVLTLNFSQLAGTFVTAITNAAGAVPYEGVPLHIRCKASTAITIATTGTFTTVTYNVEGYITQIG